MTSPRPLSELAPVLPAVLEALTRANVGVLVFVESDGRFEKWFANDPAINKLGYTLEEWYALPIFDVVSSAQRSVFVTVLERIASGGTMPPALAVSLIHRDGSEVQGELAAGRVAFSGGHALVLVVRDMGRQPQAQLSLLEADRIGLVGALAAGFAHETNNPLTSVLLNVRSLRKQLLTHMSDRVQANALRCLDDISTGAERIASNVRALQTLATRSATQSTDLSVLVSAALRLAAPTLEPRAHVIRQIFPVSQVLGEESRIGQAVLAMLLFSSSGFNTDVASSSNRIVVAVEERAGSVVVEVSDNGRDLGPEEIQRAFDPFYRSSSRGAGVGVGLGVARSVAMTLGGEVTLASRSGGGAVITMRLPPALPQ
ncbi:MAG: Sensor protein [Myxococcales bacterium]|nr:Sensor protein [Myxococcales bacterium]